MIGKEGRKIAEQIKKEGKLSFKWLYLAWFSIIFSILVYGIIGGAAGGDLKPLESFISGIGIDESIFGMTIQEIGMLIAVGILYWLLHKKGVGLDTIGLKGTLSLKAAGYAIIGTVVALLLYPLVEILAKTLGIGMLWWGEKLYAGVPSLLGWILTFVSAVILAPVLEEIVFRGYVLTMFTERMKTVFVAICISALIFTSIHIFLGPGLMIYMFFWAFIPSLLYLKFKSLYPGMLIHALNNLVAYIVLPLLGKW